MEMSSWTISNPVCSQLAILIWSPLAHIVLLTDTVSLFATLVKAQPSGFLGKWTVLGIFIFPDVRVSTHQAKGLGERYGLSMFEISEEFGGINSFPEPFLVLIHPGFLNHRSFQNSSCEELKGAQTSSLIFYFTQHRKMDCFPKYSKFLVLRLMNSSEAMCYLMAVTVMSWRDLFAFNLDAVTWMFKRKGRMNWESKAGPCPCSFHFNPSHFKQSQISSCGFCLR